ncbi:MAG: ribonuclease P protein component [Candidatus Saccharimonadales bacterium]
MLASRNRFHGLNSLRSVYKYGQALRRQQFNLRYNLNPKRQTYRCAVVVSKKVEKSAVRRNRIRRRVFEAVRLLAPRITKPYDIVISVYSASVTDLASSQLHQQIEELLATAGIIDAKPQR